MHEFSSFEFERLGKVKVCFVFLVQAHNGDLHFSR